MPKLGDKSFGPGHTVQGDPARLHSMNGAFNSPGLSIFLIPLLIVLTAGCITDEANRYYSQEHFAPKSPQSVDLLHDAPKRPYDVIADFQSRGASPEGMRREAAKIGADAVIVTTLGGQYALTDTWAGHDTQTNTYSRIVGTAIKYKDQ